MVAWRMKRHLVLAGLSSLAALLTSASAMDLPRPEPFASAHFEQERHLAALVRPLRSIGEVALSEGGFVWRQLEPFATTIEFDGATIVETTETAQGPVSRTLQDPVMDNLTRTLFGLMDGDLDAMTQRFDVERQTAPAGGWAVELRPLDTQVRDAVPRIELTGERFLERIRVTQADGDYTVIRLSRQQPRE